MVGMSCAVVEWSAGLAAEKSSKRGINRGASGLHFLQF